MSLFPQIITDEMLDLERSPFNFRELAAQDLGNAATDTDGLLEMVDDLHTGFAELQRHVLLMDQEIESAAGVTPSFHDTPEVADADEVGAAAAEGSAALGDFEGTTGPVTEPPAPSGGGGPTPPAGGGGGGGISPPDNLPPICILDLRFSKDPICGPVGPLQP